MTKRFIGSKLRLLYATKLVNRTDRKIYETV